MVLIGRDQSDRSTYSPALPASSICPSTLPVVVAAARPKRELEQYVTSAHLAARMIFTAATSFDDIDEKTVLDLGCGCAVLGIACVMMGAE